MTSLRRWSRELFSTKSAMPSRSCAWSPTGHERIAGMLNRHERNDVSAKHVSGEPYRQDPDLAFPGGDGQHVVAAVHQPRQETLDDDAAGLEYALAETECCNDAEVAVNVVLRTSPADRGEDLGGQTLALSNGMLSVGHGFSAGDFGAEVRDCGAVADSRGIRHWGSVGAHAQVGSHLEETAFVGGQVGVLGDDSDSRRCRPSTQ